jgi:hypothetical protein
MANAANAAHFSAKHVRDDPGAFRIHRQRTGSNPSKIKNAG